MVDNTLITGQEAYEITHTYLDQFENKNYEDICKKIKENAEKGISKLVLDLTRDTFTLDTEYKLKKDGFVIKKAEGRYNELYVTISWAAAGLINKTISDIIKNGVFRGDYLPSATIEKINNHEYAFKYAAVGPEIMNDIARFLGSIYETDMVAAIEYGGKTYEWDDSLGLLGSCWAAEGDTLVSVVVSELGPRLEMDKVASASIKMIGLNGSEELRLVVEIV